MGVTILHNHRVNVYRGVLGRTFLSLLMPPVLHRYCPTVLHRLQAGGIRKNVECLSPRETRS